MKIRDESAAQASLHRAEQALSHGGSLEGTGFWSAVAYLRKDRAAAARLGPLASSVDRKAFEAGVRMRVPAGIGMAGLAATTAFGVAAVWLTPRFGGWLRDAAFLVGFGALEVGTHTLAHWAVGRAMGIRFTHVFLGGPPPPRPGAKIDYASYLLVAPLRRAIMHASGAVVTKIIPFALIPLAFAAGVSDWAVWVLVVVGLGQVITDVLFSTKTSDWKRVKRELAIAKDLPKT